MVTIVFAREPIAGETKTRLIPRLGAINAAALADAFARDAIAKARRLGSPVVIAGSTPDGISKSRYFRSFKRRFGVQLVEQKGGSLGTRMAGVLGSYCADGAILFGTDTPSLPIAMLQRNIALLRRFPVVLGPSLDGGYYLVGVHGVLPDIFRGIGWGGSRVLEQTIARLERTKMRYALGPVWYDVDRWSDVLLLVAHLGLMSRRAVSRERQGDSASPSPSATNPCPTTTRLLARLGLFRLGG